MNVRDLSRQAGVVASLAMVLVLAAPYAVVSGHEDLLVAYYASGPIGAIGIALFALVSTVVFGSLERGNVDPGLLAGTIVVLGASTTLLAIVWYLAIDPNVLYSFPSEYRWLEWHAPVVVLLSVPIPACAGLYARELFGAGG